MSTSCDPWCAWRGDLVVGVRNIGQASLTSYGLQYVPPIGCELKFDTTGAAKQVLLTMLHVREPVRLSLHRPTVVNTRSVTVATLSGASPLYAKLCNELAAPSSPRVVCGLLRCPGDVKVEVALVPACADVHSFGLELTDLPTDRKGAGLASTSVGTCTAAVALSSDRLFVVFVSSASSLLMVNGYVALAGMLAEKSRTGRKKVAGGKQVSEVTAGQPLRDAELDSKKRSTGKDVTRLTVGKSNSSRHARKIKQDKLSAENQSLTPSILTKSSEEMATRLEPSSTEAGCAETISHNQPVDGEHVGAALTQLTIDQISEKSKPSKYEMSNSVISHSVADEEARLKFFTGRCNSRPLPGSSSDFSIGENVCTKSGLNAEKYVCELSKKEDKISSSEKSFRDDKSKVVLDENHNVVSCKSKSDCELARSRDCGTHEQVSSDVHSDVSSKNKNNVVGTSDGGHHNSPTSSHDCHNRRSGKTHCKKCSKTTEFREKKSRSTEIRHRKDCPRAQIVQKNKRAENTNLPVINENEEPDLAHENSALQMNCLSGIRCENDTDSSERGMSEESRVKLGKLKVEQNPLRLTSAAFPLGSTAEAGSSKKASGRLDLTFKSTKLSNSFDAPKESSGSTENYSIEDQKIGSDLRAENLSEARMSVQAKRRKSNGHKKGLIPYRKNSKALKERSELSLKCHKSHTDSFHPSKKPIKEKEDVASESIVVGKHQKSALKSCQHSRGKKLKSSEASEKRSNEDSKIPDSPHDKPRSEVVSQPASNKNKIEECMPRSMKGFSIEVHRPVVKSEVQDVSSISKQKKISKGTVVSNPTASVEVESNETEPHTNGGFQAKNRLRDSHLCEENSNQVPAKVGSEKSVDSGVLSISDLDVSTKELLTNLETSKKLQKLLSSLPLTEESFTDDSLPQALKEMKIPKNDLCKIRNKILPLILLLSPEAKTSTIPGSCSNLDDPGSSCQAQVKSERVEDNVKSELVVDVPSSKSSKIKSAAKENFKEGIKKVKKLAEKFSSKRKISGESLNIDNSIRIKKLKAETGCEIPNITVEPLVQSSLMSTFGQTPSTTESEQLVDLSSSFVSEACANEWNSVNVRPRSLSVGTSLAIHQNNSSDANCQGEPLDLSVRHDSLASDLNNSMSFSCARNYLNDMPIDGLTSSVTVGMSKEPQSFTDTLFEESCRSVLRDQNYRENSLSVLATSKSLDYNADELSCDGRNNDARVCDAVGRSLALQTPASLTCSELTEMAWWQQGSKLTSLQKKSSTDLDWCAEPVLREKLSEDNVDLVTTSVTGENTQRHGLREEYLSSMGGENLNEYSNEIGETPPSNLKDQNEVSSLFKFISCMRSLDRKILDQHAALLRNDESVREGLSYLTSLMNNRNLAASQSGFANTDSVNMYIRRQLEKLHGLQDKSELTFNWEASSLNELRQHGNQLQGSGLFQPKDTEGAAVDFTNVMDASRGYHTRGFNEASQLSPDNCATRQPSLVDQSILASERIQDSRVNTSSCALGNSSVGDDESSLRAARLFINKEAKPPLPPCGAERVQLLQRIAAELQRWPCEALQSVSTRVAAIGAPLVDSLPSNKFASVFMPSENERQQFHRLVVKLKLLFRPVSCAVEGEGGLLLLRSSALQALLLEEPWTSVLANPHIKVYTYETGSGIVEESLCPRLNCGRLLLLHHTALLDSRFGAMLNIMSRDNLQLHPAYHLVIIAKASLRRCIALALRSQPSNALEHRLFCSLRLNLQMLRRGVETGLVRVVADVGDDISALPLIHRSLHCKHRGVFLLTGARCPAGTESLSKFYRTVTLSTLYPSLENGISQLPSNANAIRSFGWEVNSPTSSPLPAHTPNAGVARQCLASTEPQQHSYSFEQGARLPFDGAVTPNAVPSADSANLALHPGHGSFEDPETCPEFLSLALSCGNDTQTRQSRSQMGTETENNLTGNGLLRVDLPSTPQAALTSPFLPRSQESSTSCQSLQSPRISSCKMNSPGCASHTPTSDPAGHTNEVDTDPPRSTPSVLNNSKDSLSTPLSLEKFSDKMGQSDQLSGKALKCEENDRENDHDDNDQPVYSALNETLLYAWKDELDNENYSK